MLVKAAGGAGGACSLLGHVPAPAKKIIETRAAFKLVDAAEAALDKGDYEQALRLLRSARRLYLALGLDTSGLDALAEDARRALETQRRLSDILAEAGNLSRRAHDILEAAGDEEDLAAVASAFAEAARLYGMAAERYADALRLLGFTDEDVDQLFAAAGNPAAYESVKSKLEAVYGGAAPIAKALMEAASLSRGLREASSLVEAFKEFIDKVNYASEHNIYDPAFLVNAAKLLAQRYDHAYAAALSTDGPGRDALSSAIAFITRELDSMINYLASENPKAAVEIVKGIQSVSKYYKPPPLATNVPQALMRSVKTLGEVVYSAAKALHDYIRSRLPSLVGEIAAGVASAVPYAAAFIVMTPAAIEYMIRTRLEQITALTRGDFKTVLEKEKELLQSMIPRNLGELLGMALLAVIGEAVGRAAKSVSVSRVAERIPGIGGLLERLREHPVAPRLARAAAAFRTGGRLVFTALMPEMDVAIRAARALKGSVRVGAAKIAERLSGGVKIKAVSVKRVMSSTVTGALNLFVRERAQKLIEATNTEMKGVKGLEGDIKRAIEAAAQRIQAMSTSSPMLAAERLVELQAVYEYLRSRIPALERKLELTSRQIRAIADTIEANVDRSIAEKLREIASKLEELESIKNKLASIETYTPGPGKRVETLETTAIPEAEKLYTQVTGKKAAKPSIAEVEGAAVKIAKETVKRVARKAEEKASTPVPREKLEEIAAMIETGRIDEALKHFKEVAKNLGVEDVYKSLEASLRGVKTLRDLEGLIADLKRKHPEESARLDAVLRLLREGKAGDAVKLADTLAASLGEPELARLVKHAAAWYYTRVFYRIAEAVKKAIREKEIDLTRTAIREMGRALRKIRSMIESIREELTKAMPASLVDEYIRLNEALSEIKIRLPDSHPLARHLGVKTLTLGDIPRIVEWVEKNAAKLTPRELLEIARFLSEVAKGFEGLAGKAATLLNKAEAVARLLDRSLRLAEKNLGPEWERLLRYVEKGDYSKALALAEELIVTPSEAKTVAEIADALEAISKYMGGEQNLAELAAELRTKAMAADLLSPDSEIVAQLEAYKARHSGYAGLVDKIRALLLEGETGEALKLAREVAAETRDTSIVKAVEDFAKRLRRGIADIVLEELGPAAADIAEALRAGDVGKALAELARRAMKGDLPLEPAEALLRYLGADRYARILEAYKLVSRSPGLGPAARYLSEMDIASAVKILKASDTPEARKALSLLEPLIEKGHVEVSGAELVKYGQVAEYLDRLASLAPSIGGLLRQAAEALRQGNVKAAARLLSRASRRLKAEDVTSRAALLNAIDLIARAIPGSARVFGEVTAIAERIVSTREMPLEELASLMREIGVRREIELPINAGAEVKAVRTTLLGPDASLVYELTLNIVDKTGREKPVAGYELVIKPGGPGEVIRAESYWVDPEAAPLLKRTVEDVVKDIRSVIASDPLLEKLRSVAPIIEYEVRNRFGGIPPLPPWMRRIYDALPPSKFFAYVRRPPARVIKSGIVWANITGYVHGSTAVVTPTPGTLLVVRPSLVKALKTSVIAGVPALTIELSRPLTIGGVKVSTIVIPGVKVNTSILDRLSDIVAKTRSKPITLEIAIEEPGVRETTKTRLKEHTQTVETTKTEVEIKTMTAPVTETKTVETQQVRETPSTTTLPPPETPSEETPRGQQRARGARVPHAFGSVKLWLTPLAPGAWGSATHVTEKLMV